MRKNHFNPLSHWFSGFSTIQPEKTLKQMVQYIEGLIKGRLWLKVLIGLVLGFICGLMLGPELNLVSRETANTITNWLALPGNIFIRLVKMIIIPLIFSSIAIGIVSSGSPGIFKKVAPAMIIYYVLTTAMSVVIGFVLAFIIKPGKYNTGITPASQLTEQAGNGFDGFSFSRLPDLIIGLIPDNPFQVIISGELLGVIFFTVLTGIALLNLDNRYAEPVVRLLESIQQLCLIIVRWAMELAPYAVFGLIAQVISKTGLETMKGLGVYVLTVIAGLFSIFLFYIILITLTGYPPRRFLRASREVLLLAFSTSSSAATMPVSIKTAEDNLGVKPVIAQFLIPVGATINMNGTALYQAVATIFLAQLFGVELTISSLIMIVVITVGASIGTPATPGVGIIILATILDTIGIPAEGIALILGVDRLLDMFRTVINVAGDLTACVVFDRLFSAELDHPAGTNAGLSTA